MRNFKLVRDRDISGISGTGVVVEGVVFSDGHAAIHWINTPYPMTTPHPAGLESVMYLHAHGGATRLVWEDEGRREPGFAEEDIAFLHELLSMPGESVSHERARKLLKKVRVAMEIVPAQKTVP